METVVAREQIAGLLAVWETERESFTTALEAKNARIQELETQLNMQSEPMMITAEVSSYAPLDPDAVEGMCYSGDPHITATGTQVRPGVVAADFNKLPPGTVVKIPGYGIGVVEDTGSALRKHDGYALDVFMEKRSDALRWGRQILEVEILYLATK